MVKIDVPYISQKGKYPTGCESVSTVMLLQFLGYDISVDTFIENYLECRKFEMRDGQIYGADPNEHFCGSPYSEDDFGCYAPVIKKALEKAIGESYDIIDETGKPMEWLLRNYIDKGMPVVFWACIGYDADGYYFNDPYEGHGVIHYPKALVENRHRAQYEMAVGVIKKN